MKPWEAFTNQNQWKKYIQNLLRTNDRALYKAIVLIAEYQTPEELVYGATIDHNNRGFGAVDAEMMSALALRIKNGGTLTPKELAISRNKMPKYWKQLYRIAKNKQEPQKEDKVKKGPIAICPEGGSPVKIEWDPETDINTCQFCGWTDKPKEERKTMANEELMVAYYRYGYCFCMEYCEFLQRYERNNDENKKRRPGTFIRR